MKASKRIGQFIFSLFLLNSVMYAESFRVSKTYVAEVTQDIKSEATVRAGIMDAIAIKLPEDQIFIEGLELKFEIPEAVASWTDSVACSIYSNIKPAPKSTQIDYSGTRTFVTTLPGKLSWVMQIPLTPTNSIKSNNYTTKVDAIIKPENNFVFVRLQPVMKGIPEETYNSIVPVTIKPILSKKGLLKVNLSAAENTTLEPCTVYIDDKLLPADNTMLLDTGIHNISVISEAYRNEVRTVRIDQAKSTEISIEMKSIEPTLLITAPEGTSVTFDDEPCNIIGKEFVITEGDHKIKFSIGDYELVRQISAIKGRTYKANFALDLQIEEE